MEQKNKAGENPAGNGGDGHMGKMLGITSRVVKAKKIRETDKAYQLEIDDEAQITDWFPKSQVCDKEDGRFEIMLWLLKEKGYYREKQRQEKKDRFTSLLQSTGD